MQNIKPLTVSIFLAVTSTFNSGCVDEQVAQQETAPSFIHAWTLTEGLAQPESVVYDAKHSRLYVSNVQGDPNEKDSKGYIAIVSLEGKLLEQQWLKNLDAPKGMTIVGDTLYVSDIDTLVAIDTNKGEIIERYESQDAKFLNDVTADKDGNVYVSDMFANTIYCLCEGKFEIWLQDANLMEPNGLLAEEDRLLVAGSTSTPGYLKAVSYADKKITSFGDGQVVGDLDGLESDGASGYYVTEFTIGKLLHIDAAGKTQEIMQFSPGSADLAYLVEQNLLFIPMLIDSQLNAFKKYNL